MLPLALAVIVFGSAVPVELRAPVLWSTDFSSRDFVLNVLLYTPLGIALWRRPIVAIVVGTTLLSTAIEIVQIWSVARHASTFDVLANVVGASAGAGLAQQIAQSGRAALDTVPIDRRLTASAVVGMMALLTAGALPVSPSNISNWDPGFELLLGNERTSDRPWRGTLEALALVPASLRRDEVCDLGDLTEPGVQAALVARGAYLLPEAVTLVGTDARPLPPDVTRRFFDLAVKQNAFTIIARVATADVHQQGPARLISFSRDQFHRNFDLGQEGARLFFRVRTSTTGPNGMDPHTETSRVLEADRAVTVVATFDGSLARVYVDGQARGHANLAAAGCVIPALCDSDVPIASALFGMLLALVAIASLRPQSRLRALVLALLAGVLGAVVLRVLYGATASLLFTGWTPLIVLAGASCAGSAIATAHRIIDPQSGSI